MRTFFDSNVLVYLFDEDYPEKKAQAQALLEKETENGRILLSTQVLQEFYVTVTRKLELPLSPEKAEESDLADLKNGRFMVQIPGCPRILPRIVFSL